MGTSKILALFVVVVLVGIASVACTFYLMIIAFGKNLKNLLPVDNELKAGIVQITSIFGYSKSEYFNDKIFRRSDFEVRTVDVHDGQLVECPWFPKIVDSDPAVMNSKLNKIAESLNDTIIFHNLKKSVDELRESMKCDMIIGIGVSIGGTEILKNYDLFDLIFPISPVLIQENYKMPELARVINGNIQVKFYFAENDTKLELGTVSHATEFVVKSQNMKMKIFKDCDHAFSLPFVQGFIPNFVMFKPLVYLDLMRDVFREISMFLKA